MPTIMTGQPVVVGRVGSLYEGVTAAVGVTVRVIVGGGETETVTVDGEMEALDGAAKVVVGEDNCPGLRLRIKSSPATMSNATSRARPKMVVAEVRRVWASGADSGVISSTTASGRGATGASAVSANAAGAVPLPADSSPSAWAKSLHREKRSAGFLASATANAGSSGPIPAEYRQIVAARYSSVGR